MGEKNGQLNEYEVKKFLSVVGEKLVIATRRHWFVLATPIVAILAGSATLVLISLSLSLLIPLFAKTTFFISSLLLITSITLSFITKTVVDWYCHLYIVTTRKILEVCHAPLTSSKINEVLLDKVRCTEVDIKVNGPVEEFIDIGDVIVTFDRPTHQEEFTFEGIKDPKTVGLFLSDILDGPQESSSGRWYRQRGKPRHFQFMEELFPKYYPTGGGAA